MSTNIVVDGVTIAIPTDGDTKQQAWGLKGTSAWKALAVSTEDTLRTNTASGTPITAGGGVNKILDTDSVVNDLTTGGTDVPLSAEQGKTLETTKQAVGNYPTMAANGTSGNLIKSAGNDRTQADAGVATEDAPTNSTAKLTTSQWLYRQSGQDSDWFKEYRNTAAANLNGTASDTWYKVSSGHTLSLSAGTWRIFYKVGIYCSAATSVTRTDAGLSTEGADGVEPLQTDSITSVYIGTNATSLLSCHTGFCIVTLASPGTICIKGKATYAGTFSALATGTKMTYMYAQRVY